MLKTLSKECLKCRNPLCIKGCPVHNDIKEIISLINENKLEEAYRLNLKTSVLPFVCGVLCPHEKQCVGHCVKSLKGNGVKIGKIEELLSKENNYAINKLDNSLVNLNICIIGGGISGISAAIDAARHGANVTIYEKTDKLGGPLFNSIPDFRFESFKLNIINDILHSLGVNVYYNIEYGNNLFLTDLEKFDKVVFATGTMIETKPIKENHPYFIGAVELLEKLKKNITFSNVKKAIVLGAGNVATDIARSLNKAGIKTQIVYRRTFKYSPALKAEINECLEENIELIEKLSPVSLVIADSILTGVKFEVMEESCELDKTNRPIFKSTNYFKVLDCDLVVYATGQKPDLSIYKNDFDHLIDGSWLKSAVNIVKDGKFYFIGDVVSGATSIVNSMKAGMNIVTDMINERKIFMFGGSFDPVTLVHEEIVKTIIKEFGDNTLIYIVPNGDNYHFDGKELTSFSIRKEMLEKAFSKYHKNIYVSDIEQKEEFVGVYKTLEDLNHPIYIIGSDLLYTLPRWKNFDGLMKKNKFYLIERASFSLDVLNEEPLLSYKDRFIVSNYKFENISSTEYRINKDENLISKEIKEIIEKYQIYGGGKNND